MLIKRLFHTGTREEYLDILVLVLRISIAAFMLTMMVAAFITHGDQEFGRKEMALLYLLFYMVFFILGSRKYSMDYLLFRSPPTSTSNNPKYG